MYINKINNEFRLDKNCCMLSNHHDFIMKYIYDIFLTDMLCCSSDLNSV